MATASHTARAALARHHRFNPGDVDEEQRLRRELAELRIAEFIEKVVAKAPPLDSEQCEHIAALLKPG